MCSGPHQAILDLLADGAFHTFTSMRRSCTGTRTIPTSITATVPEVGSGEPRSDRRIQTGVHRLI